MERGDTRLLIASRDGVERARVGRRSLEARKLLRNEERQVVEMGVRPRPPLEIGRLAWVSAKVLDSEVSVGERPRRIASPC